MLNIVQNRVVRTVPALSACPPVTAVVQCHRAQAVPRKVIRHVLVTAAVLAQAVNQYHHGARVALRPPFLTKKLQSILALP